MMSVSYESERTLAVMQSGIVFADELTGAQGVIAELATALDIPIAALTVVGQYYQHFKASIGVSAKFIPRERSFCAHTILQNAPLIVSDLRLDPRFHDHPFVVGPPQLRFYAGIPLRTLSGHRLGTVCVMDIKPRTLGSYEQIKLAEAAATMTQLLRRQQAARQAASLRRSIASEMHQGDIGRVRHLRGQLSQALLHQFHSTFPPDSSSAYVE